MAKPEASTKKYVANWQIKGLGERPLEAGDYIALSDDAAKPFVACGALRPCAEPSAAKSDE